MFPWLSVIFTGCAFCIAGNRHRCKVLQRRLKEEQGGSTVRITGNEAKALPGGLDMGLPEPTPSGKGSAGAAPLPASLRNPARSLVNRESQRANVKIHYPLRTGKKSMMQPASS
ncbi:hypothetical protein TWF569_008103 [Orbilia oligospora]|uniref:Uncharacterized protein n=1 Tax=Orbilia oligospora TaxID=2813651 RepID=A0A7C8NK56_ORBOL|nr:hypothetical protein TWF706_009103 [Orbilia oligospora]KAF3100268.1 hypothetical protein TWF103_008289 [Orbilia oligospora]KAF3112668.1 hypothetical protein TWF102_004069 [Orbilia oligospora]KAF3123274.1 hypothetical protein TWF594_002492 [Orbilia oligospora]KAF3141221.1 hypothetical protein TWF569_008103 [Orbilia oligospora]